MILFVCSVLWDLDILQEAPTILYKENYACTAMGNAQKPTPRTRHMVIKYFPICEWVEKDLMHLNESIPQSTWSTTSRKRSIGHYIIDTPIFS
jgi:hypothetical protein